MNVLLQRIWYFHVSIFLLIVFLCAVYLNAEVLWTSLVDIPVFKTNEYRYGAGAVYYTVASAFIYAALFVIYTESSNMTSIFKGKLSNEIYLYISFLIIFIFYIANIYILSLGIEYKEAGYAKNIDILSETDDFFPSNFMYDFIVYYIACVTPLFFILLSYSVNTFIKSFRGIQANDQEINKTAIAAIVIGVLLIPLFLISFSVAYKHVNLTFSTGVVIYKRADLATASYMTLWIFTGWALVRMFLTRSRKKVTFLVFCSIVYISFFILGNVMYSMSDLIMHNTESIRLIMKGIEPKLANIEKTNLQIVAGYLLASLHYIGLLIPVLIIEGIYKVLFQNKTHN